MRKVGVSLLVATAMLATGTAPAPAQAAVPSNVEAYTAFYAGAVVERTFKTIYARQPTAAERAYWTWQIVDQRTSTFLAGKLMSTSTFKSGLGRLPPKAFVETMLRNATGRVDPNLRSRWTAAIAGGSATRSRFVGWTVESQFKPALGQPVRRVEGCKGFNQSGLRPVCTRGTAGHQRNVSVVQVPGTNIYVNRAWFRSFARFHAAARSQGFSLTATRRPEIPSWMFAPGSWRSFDEQRWLYQHGYPANPPGRSMHEWGLAVDLDCNGQSIIKVPRCWSWMRSNSAAYGVHLFRRVGSITDSEAWHVSSNGY